MVHHSHILNNLDPFWPIGPILHNFNPSGPILNNLDPFGPILIHLDLFWPLWISIYINSLNRFGQFWPKMKFRRGKLVKTVILGFQKCHNWRIFTLWNWSKSRFADFLEGPKSLKFNILVCLSVKIQIWAIWTHLDPFSPIIPLEFGCE